jgi:hypothetical protein
MERIKSAKLFVCEKCNFKSSKQSGLERHLLTAKHKSERIKTPKAPKVLNCVCGNTYKAPSGLWKHKKICFVINDTNSVVENIEDKPSIMDFISQNKEIMDALVLHNEELTKRNNELNYTIIEQSVAIRELIPKIGNNNNNNNQFNIQVFLNEDCKDALNFSEFIKQIQVSLTDLENQAENGYIKGITKLFIENLQGLGINKRPIHCTDKKRKTLYIKENNEWDKEGSQDILKKGIQEVTRRTFEQLIKEQEIHSDEYDDADSEFSTKCISIQRNLTPNHPRETTISKVIDNITQNSGIL